jgi:hypothetical protein
LLALILFLLLERPRVYGQGSCVFVVCNCFCSDLNTAVELSFLLTPHRRESMIEAADLNAELQNTTTAAVVAPVTAGMHLSFVPDTSRPRMMLWGGEAANSPLAVAGDPGSLMLPDEALKVRRVRGYFIPLLDAVTQLAAMTQVELQQTSSSIAVWSLAAKLALELVVRERIVPRVIKQSGEQVARWSVTLNLPEDAQRVTHLARAFPVAAHAVLLRAIVTPGDDAITNSSGAPQVWSAAALLREFLDSVADQLVRAAAVHIKPYKSKVVADQTHVPWPRRFYAALTTGNAQFIPEGVQERAVLSELRHWVHSVVGIHADELQLPPVDSTEFTLRFGLQRSEHDEVNTDRQVVCLVDAAALFANNHAAVKKLNCDLRVAQEQLLQKLAVAARSFAPIEAELRKPRPEKVSLKPRLAWEFITQRSSLQQAGMVVQLPAVLMPAAQQRLQLRMCIGSNDTQCDRQHQLAYQWRAELAGVDIDIADLQALSELRTPLTRFHDDWVVLDPKELSHAAKLLRQGGGQLSMPLALSLALTESITQADSGLRITVEAQGALAELVAQMREREAVYEVPVPSTLHAVLRPYQQRGMSWLTHLSNLGLGACLADDMGLGKTIQLLAWLLHRQATQPDDTRPVLLVCPTSVVGNWEREIARFAPSLQVLRHYGIQRIQNAEDFQVAATGQLVITSYGLMRRDVAWLRDAEFAAVVLDEAQFIKNASSATARAARSLQAGERIAMTGTPVENRLAELWSIMEFLNPGLMGPHETFRREIAIPVERYGREDVALRLRRMVAPFILRRVKTDPGIVSDLPAKQETKVFCSLTREQASLYQGAIDEAFDEIESADGITRRGRVLALLTALKQICNHPAHYLREKGPLTGRSGKLDRLCEMMEEVLAAGDRALVFTQYREMGERLVQALSRIQGKPVPFLHGGVARAARDEMVRRFQEAPKSSRILIVSLKAGGTGLNLTAATQVFHFDRWWNPAVEDQATDRAHRIGQQRKVQVYKLLCAGTVDEKIDQMLESKRDLAARVVTGGESWITELDNAALHELFALAPNAVVGEAPDADEPDDQLAAVKLVKPRRRAPKAVTEGLP